MEVSGGFVRPKLPTKLTNPWTGPSPVVSVPDNRHCVILKDGKEIKHNVNRLSKQHHWDDMQIRRKHLRSPMSQKTKLLVSQVVKKKISKKVNKNTQKRNRFDREKHVFPMNLSDTHPLPFGVGRISEIRAIQDLKFQWLGNPAHSPKGNIFTSMVLLSKQADPPLSLIHI